MGLIKRKNRNPDDLQPEDVNNPDPPKDKVKWSKRPASESRTRRPEPKRATPARPSGVASASASSRRPVGCR